MCVCVCVFVYVHTYMSLHFFSISFSYILSNGIIFLLSIKLSIITAWNKVGSSYDMLARADDQGFCKPCQGPGRSACGW